MDKKRGAAINNNVCLKEVSSGEAKKSPDKRELSELTELSKYLIKHKSKKHNQLKS